MIRKKEGETNEYEVLLNSDVKTIIAKNGKICSLIITKNVKQFIDSYDKLCHLECTSFVRKMDVLMEQIDETYLGSKLVVVFMTFAAVVNKQESH